MVAGSSKLASPGLPSPSHPPHPGLKPSPAWLHTLHSPRMHTLNHYIMICGTVVESSLNATVQLVIHYCCEKNAILAIFWPFFLNAWKQAHWVCFEDRQMLWSLLEIIICELQTLEGLILFLSWDLRHLRLLNKTFNFQKYKYKHWQNQIQT